jgi:L-asparagine oxygenase
MARESLSLTEGSEAPPAAAAAAYAAPAAEAPKRRAGVAVLEIERELSARLQRALSDLVSPYDHLEEALHQAAGVFATVAHGWLSRRIRDFRYDPALSGGLLVTGLPVDPELPTTPIDGKRCRDKRTFVSEGVALAFASMLGEPYGFEDEKDGETIHNICPVAGRQAARSNEGSSLDFLFHTEVAFHHLRPDFLLLFCLRADHRQDARTYFEDLAAVYDDLDGEDAEILRQPLFVLQAPESFERGRERAVCLNFNAMKALSEPAERALERLRTLLYRPDRLKEVNLAAGDLLLLHNRKAVHGRSPFTARFDGTDRWLQRVYIREDLWRHPEGPAYPSRTVRSAWHAGAAAGAVPAPPLPAEA